MFKVDNKDTRTTPLFIVNDKNTRTTSMMVLLLSLNNGIIKHVTAGWVDLLTITITLSVSFIRTLINVFFGMAFIKENKPNYSLRSI